MTLPTDEMQIILTEVSLGKARADSVLAMTPEREEFWDAMERETREIAARGHQIMIPNEWPDLTTYVEGKATPLEDI